jgi:hypothetical protein
MSGFAIICDARKGHGLGIDILVLVDRGKCRSQWWTSDDPTIALDYTKKSAAQFAARRLKRNHARVVPFEHAVQALRDQAREIMHNEAMDDAEAGWDGHKGYCA